jgi:hypothetical protein
MGVNDDRETLTLIGWDMRLIEFRLGLSLNYLAKPSSTSSGLKRNYVDKEF